MEQEKQIFADAFNFLRNNFEVGPDQAYWDEIVQQQTELEQKYKGNQFAVDMFYACVKRMCERCDKGV